MLTGAQDPADTTACALRMMHQAVPHRPSLPTFDASFSRPLALHIAPNLEAASDCCFPGDRRSTPAHRPIACPQGPSSDCIIQHTLCLSLHAHVSFEEVRPLQWRQYPQLPRASLKDTSRLYHNEDTRVLVYAGWGLPCYTVTLEGVCPLYLLLQSINRFVVAPRHHGGCFLQTGSIRQSS